MANNQRIMEAVIRIGGEMDNSVKRSMLKAGNAFTTLNKKCASLEKKAVKVAAGMTAAFAATATAVAAAFVKMGDELNQTFNNISAKTGATGAELEEISKSAIEIWKSGLGESLNDVSNALVEVKQTAGLAGKELESAAKYGIMMRDTFGFELNESTRAASALMKHFGVSAEEAYGLITLGAQKGANKNGDLLDTVNEYAVHYKALGLTAEQFMAGLIKGAENGSFSIDKVGDAIKEFTIRSKDGSKKSLEAFQTLGLNGEEMTRAFAAGGDKAAAAFQQTIAALQAIEDPVKRNAVGVALFGTMFEDLEAGMLDTMASMSGASLEAEAALQHVADVKYDDLGSSITQIKRAFYAQLIPAAQQAAAMLQEHMPAIQAAIARVTPVIADLAMQFVNFLPVLIEGGINLIPQIISNLQGIFNWLTQNKDTILSIIKVLGVMYASIRGLSITAGIINNIQTCYKGLKNAIIAAKSAAILCGKAIKALTWTNIKAKAAVVAHTVATKAQTIAMKAYAAGQWLANAALKAFPIMLIVAGITAVIAAIALLWKNWDKITAWMSKVWQAFANRFPKTAAALKAAWDAVCKAFKYVWDLLCTGLSLAWEGVCYVFTSLFEAFAAVFKSVWEVLKSFFSGIADFYMEIWAAVCDLFTGNWDGFCEHFKSAGEIVQQGWNAICDGIGAAFDFICEGLKSAWEGVKSFFVSAADFLGGIFSSMWDGIKSAAVTVFEAIPGLIKTPINAVVCAINAVIDAINGIGFTIPDWVPGIGGKRFSVNVPKLPMLAAGGFTNGVSIAGEAGTEAVISFDPAYRRENQGYLMTAAEMLGMTAAPKSSSNTTINLGGLTFSPVVHTGDNVESGNIIQQLRACIPDLLDMIENGLKERETHRYV